MTGCWTWPAGSGNAAIPAALAGASVVACDLTPELLETGRALAAQRGAELEWHDQGEGKMVMAWEYLLLTARKHS